MEILNHLLGSENIGYYISFYIFSFFGFTVFSFIRYSDKSNSEFSFKYFVRHNWQDLLFWVLGTFLAARFESRIETLIFSVDVSKMLFAFGWGYLNINIVRIVRSKINKHKKK